MKGKTIKNIALSMCFLLSMLLFVGIANGCSGNRVKTDGFFEYIVIDDNTSTSGAEKVVAIVGFSALGLRQEALEIPREIDGMPVRCLGGRNKNQLSLVGPVYYTLESRNLKKLYMHDNVTDIEHEAFDFWLLPDRHLDIMVCSTSGFPSVNNCYFNSFALECVNLYIYKAIYDVLDEPSGRDKYSPLTKDATTPANIVFMNNYSDEVNDGYYRLDNIESGEKIPTPPIPVRSGYAFGGWYTEAECINAWDFDVSPSIEEDSEFRLYAAWQPT